MAEEVRRADVALVERGLAPSRERAQGWIRNGFVTCNGKTVQKPSQPVLREDALLVTNTEHDYVGRGALKLEKAIECFAPCVNGVVAMDIGASTGGFTDVLLRNGAKKVYAIDVGHSQLAPSLLADSRVVNMENTNARTLSKDMFPERPTLAVMDVSFISIKLILPAAFSVLGQKGRMISLIKPQFEAGRSNIGKGGIVKDKKVWKSVLTDIVAFVPLLGWQVQNIAVSPIRGGDGNTEFLADIVPMEKCESSCGEKEIDALLKTI